MKLIRFAFVLFFSVAHGQVTTGKYNSIEQDTFYHSKQVIVFPDRRGIFEDSLCLVSKNAKYGIIDSTGQEVVPLIYDELKIDFSIREVILYQLRYPNEYFYDYWEDGYESEEIYAKLLELELKNPTSYLHVSKKFRSNPLFSAKKESLWGVINKSNEIIIPFRYDFVEEIGQDIFLVKTNGKSGVINSENEVVVPITCDTIRLFPIFSFGILENMKYVKYPLEIAAPSSFALLKQGNKFGAINLFTQKVIPPTYDSLEMCINLPEYDCTCGFTLNGIWSIFKRGTHYSIHSFNNVLKFQIDTKFGLLNIASMSEVAPPIYNSIELKDQNIVQLNGNYSLMLDQNSALDPESYTEISPLGVDRIRPRRYKDPHITFYKVKKDGCYGLLNEKGEKVTNIEWDTIISCSQMMDTSTYQIIVKRKGKLGVVNNYNQIIVPIKHDSFSLEYDAGYHYLLHRRGRSKKVLIE